MEALRDSRLRETRCERGTQQDEGRREAAPLDEGCVLQAADHPGRAGRDQRYFLPIERPTRTSDATDCQSLLLRAIEVTWPFPTPCPGR